MVVSYEQEPARIISAFARSRSHSGFIASVIRPSKPTPLVLFKPRSRGRLPSGAFLCSCLRRLANYLRTLVQETQALARACGKSRVQNLEPEDLVALTVEAAAMARVPLAGTGWIPGAGAY